MEIITHDNYIIAKDINHKIFVIFTFSLLIISTLIMHYTVFTVLTLLFMEQKFHEFNEF